ncbi:MAG: TIGR03915 family putative DNA repair protein [Clostridia bacterium]|nr:TIGR03915 family putative DNA repair protein [Clostridia bacterium]
MPGKKPIAIVPENSLWLYDGSLKGFYCCVYESVYSRRLPIDIRSAQADDPTLLPEKYIETDAGRAARVRRGISRNISEAALSLVETVFLSCLVQKEITTLRFLLFGFAQGERALSALHNPVVHAMRRAEQHLRGEAHLLTGFIRFSDHGGALIASIQPKNFVLPFLADHFLDRLQRETFMIYDKTHHAALIQEKGRRQIVEIENVKEFLASEEELHYQALWKQYYRTIAIEARHNPKCRMTHMPKRYWAEMTEMRDMVSPNG